MKVLVSALETSSNLHLEYLLKELDENVQITGIFDKRLGTPLLDNSEMAVMGFVDAIKRLPFFFRMKDKMVELAKDVDKVLLMDSSGFNLPLAKAIKKKYPEKEIIYYILPQAWAWRQGRIPKIEAVTDRLCSILPFEKSFYKDKEKISYVGHPLLDEIVLKKETLTHNGVVAFMPGSRRSEIKSLMPVFNEVKKEIDARALLIVPPFFDQNKLEEIYGKEVHEYEISTNTQEALVQSDFAFICSGTATLEATLIGTPFVLAYVAKKLDYFLVSRLANIRYVGLANILSDKAYGKTIHKEFLQETVTKDNLLKEYKEQDRELFMQNASKVADYLAHGSAKNVANMINAT